MRRGNTSCRARHFWRVLVCAAHEGKSRVESPTMLCNESFKFDRQPPHDHANAIAVAANAAAAQEIRSQSAIVPLRANQSDGGNMAKYSRSASKDVEIAMERRKKGTLKSGPGGKGGTVKSRKQAIAIGLSEARAKGKKVPTRNKTAAKKKTMAKRKTAAKRKKKA
jgi:hypothetical protein